MQCFHGNQDATYLHSEAKKKNRVAVDCIEGVMAAGVVLIGSFVMATL